MSWEKEAGRVRARGVTAPRPVIATRRRVELERDWSKGREGGRLRRNWERGISHVRRVNGE